LEDLVANFEWDRPEYFHVLRFGSLPWISRYPTIGLLIILAAVEDTVINGSNGAQYLYAFGIVMILYQVIMNWFIARRVWVKLWGASPEATVIIGEDSVTSVTGLGETSFKWVAYPRSKEWKSYYFLKHNRLIVTLIIPKRGFATPNDEARFRQVLRERTATKLKSDVTTANEVP
jgi:hypothetical protein